MDTGSPESPYGRAKSTRSTSRFEQDGGEVPRGRWIQALKSSACDDDASEKAPINTSKDSFVLVLLARRKKEKRNPSGRVEPSGTSDSLRPRISVLDPSLSLILDLRSRSATFWFDRIWRKVYLLTLEEEDGFGREQEKGGGQESRSRGEKGWEVCRDVVEDV